MLAIALSVCFLALFLPTQWYFSEFLLSDSSKNAFFAGGRFYPYFTHPGSWQMDFWIQHDPVPNAKSIAVMLGIGALASGIGLSVGGWMSRVQR